MKLTLLKQTNIDIDIHIFIENILKLYYSERPADGDTFNDEINSVVKDMIGCDLYDYDNTYEVMTDILNRAMIYAVRHGYSQTDIKALVYISDVI